MSTSPTVPPKDEIRHVVIEHNKPLQMRLKQYVVVKTINDGDIKGKVGQIIKMQEQDAMPYLGARFIMPLDVAIREKMYPLYAPHKETVIEKVVETITGTEITHEPEENAESDKAPKKSFLGNQLREAIQSRKAPSAGKIDAAKLAAIRGGGQ